MASEILVLKADPIKGRLNGIALPAVIATATAVVALAILHEFRFGIYAFIAVAAILGAFLVWLTTREQPEESIELRGDGLAVVTDRERHFFRWQDLSRFTLLEEVSRSADNKTKAGSQFLAARLLKPATGEGASDVAPDAATGEREADLLIPIDPYISLQRHSGRIDRQEAACSSPRALADTVNAWRDLALDLEIGAVPTPFLQTENSARPGIILKLDERHGG